MRIRFENIRYINEEAGELFNLNKGRRNAYCILVGKIFRRMTKLTKDNVQMDVRDV
jgi:hypothetical protein